MNRFIELTGADHAEVILVRDDLIAGIIPLSVVNVDPRLKHARSLVATTFGMTFNVRETTDKVRMKIEGFRLPTMGDNMTEVKS